MGGFIMRDITHYSDQELSLLVFNEQYFYIERHNRPFLMALIQEEFKYTDKQLEILINDLAEDLEENPGGK